MKSLVVITLAFITASLHAADPLPSWNDGALWGEQPMYFQAFFIFDRIKQLAPTHPEWKDKEPFASVLKGDLKSALAGGGIEFMRPWTGKVYGIPPEQVIGSSIKTKFELRDGKPVLARLPELNFIDDKEGKPVAIQQHIGRRPIIAFGNSDGDFQMLEWTTAGKGPRLALIVHHDDTQREYAYDRGSHIGKLEKALDEAPQRGWPIISMKNDWKNIHR